MKRTKLPTDYKGGQKCNSCGAVLIHRYDTLNDVYFYSCQNCNMIRCEPSARFKVQFQGANEL